MGANVFDTLAASRMLMEHGLSREAAEGVAELVGNTIDTQLATSQDILLLRKDILTLEKELRKDMTISHKNTLLAIGGMLACAVTILLGALPMLLK